MLEKYSFISARLLGLGNESLRGPGVLMGVQVLSASLTSGCGPRDFRFSTVW